MSDEHFNERTQKAFDFYADSTKQLITLSTAIIAVTITFAKEILGDLPSLAKFSLMIALVGYLISVVCGLGTLLSLTGALQPIELMRRIACQKQFVPKSPPQSAIQEWPIPSIYDKKITTPSRVQVISFAAATLLIVITGILVALPKSNNNDESALKELESQWVQAYAQRDGALLKRILATDYFIINNYGAITDKKQFISIVARSELTIESIEPTDIKVRLYGDTAIVTGIHKYNVKIENQGKIEIVRYTNAYVKQQGRWQLASTQETSIH